MAAAAWGPRTAATRPTSIQTSAEDAGLDRLLNDGRHRLVDRAGGRQVDGQGHQGQDEQALQRDQWPVGSGFGNLPGWSAAAIKPIKARSCSVKPTSKLSGPARLGLGSADPGDPGDEQAVHGQAASQATGPPSAGAWVIPRSKFRPRQAPMTSGPRIVRFSPAS